MFEHGRPVYANPKAAEIFRYPSADALLACPDFSALAAPHEVERIRATERARTRGEEAPVEYETEGRCADGRTVDLLNRPTPITWQGEPATLVTVVDITERKRRRRAEAEQAAVFQRILDNVDHGVSLFDGNGICLAVNQRARELLEVPEAVYHVGCRYDDLVRFIARRGEYGDGSPEEHVGTWNSYGADGRPVVIERTRENGVTLELRRTPFADGGFIATHTDITARKQAEAALGDSEKRYRTLTEGSLQGIGIAQDNAMAFVNRAFADLLGYTPEEMTGRPVTDFIMPAFLDLMAKRRAARLAGDNPPERYDFQARHRDGHAVWVDQLVQSTTWNGRPATQVTVLDISQRKAAEAAVLAAKEEAELANRAKSEFLAHFSHELRTPLNAIIGFSEMMLREFFGALGHERYREYASDIRESGDHLLALINDILDLSRIESGRWERDESAFDLLEVMRECTRLLRNRAEARGVAFDVAYPDEAATLTADRRQVQQILLNLISNAVKFTAEASTIRLAVDLGAGDGLRIRIDDEGPGMSESDIARVQEPFVRLGDAMTSAVEGTGLGLAISKRLAENHGGWLRLERGPGAGTRATVWFPAWRCPTTAVDREATTTG